jgi:hypothetical protein
MQLTKTYIEKRIEVGRSREEEVSLPQPTTVEVLSAQSAPGITKPLEISSVGDP